MYYKLIATFLLLSVLAACGNETNPSAPMDISADNFDTISMDKKALANTSDTQYVVEKVVPTKQPVKSSSTKPIVIDRNKINGGTRPTIKPKPDYSGGIKIDKRDDFSSNDDLLKDRIKEKLPPKIIVKPPVKPIPGEVKPVEPKDQAVDPATDNNDDDASSTLPVSEDADDSTTTTISDRIKGQFVDFIKGSIGYQIPDSMTVNQVSRVAVRINDLNTSVEEVKISVSDLSNLPSKKVSPSQVKVEKINLSKVMEAELTCSSNSGGQEVLRITPIGNARQVLDENNNYYAIWQWDVMPLKKGNYPLNLEINAIISDKNGEYPQNFPVFTKEIHVQASKSSYKTLLFVLLGLVLAGVGGFFAYRFVINKKVLLKASISAADAELARSAIRSANTEKAITIIETKGKNLPKQLKNQLVTHHAELKETDNKCNMGIIEQEELNKVVNRINYTLLELLSEMEE